MAELTVAAIKAAKPRDRKYRLAAGGRLALEVRPNGGKYWRWRYRDPAGRENEMSYGVWPDVGLAEARRLRDADRELLKAGIDPSAKRKGNKLAKELAASDRLQDVCEEWIQTKAPEWADTYTEKVRLRFANDVYPYIGRRPIAELTAPELLQVLRRTAERGVVDTTHRIRRCLSQVFRFAIAQGRATRDPAADLRDALPAYIRQRFPTITDPDRIGQLLRAIDGYSGTHVVRAALQLAPLVFVRPGELRKAEWAEMDLVHGVWTIPPARLKLRKVSKVTADPLVVPLSRQAVDILTELHPLTGRWPYVFPGARDHRRTMSENTVNGALHALGFKGELVGHGLRHMASTLLNEQGWAPDAIERQLAHVDGSVRGIYNQAQYMPERRQMMQAWADYLDTLRADVSIRKRA